MTKYNTSYDPPAPTANITLKKIESSERMRDIEMILDTGSDITLLPNAILAEFGIEPSGKEKYELVGFDGPHAEWDEIQAVKTT
jgi:hypothetical protein